MPTPTTTKLPVPRSWDEFEDISADVLKRTWNDPYVTRNGRSGQAQNGVDIYGLPSRLNPPSSPPRYAVAQCKAVDSINFSQVEVEVAKVADFVPAPVEYILMTTMERDVKLQQDVRTASWPFRVEVMFWEDISLALSGHQDLLAKHFPNWITSTVGTQLVMDRVSASAPEDYVYNDETGIFLHRDDVKLRIVFDRTYDSVDGFDEPWVHRFPDPKARRQAVYIEYDGARIHTANFVHCDGARYILPFPKSGSDLRISPAQYHLGHILSYPFREYGFDEGLRRAGISVDQSLAASAPTG